MDSGLTPSSRSLTSARWPRGCVALLTQRPMDPVSVGPNSHIRGIGNALAAELGGLVDELVASWRLYGPCYKRRVSYRKFSIIIRSLPRTRASIQGAGSSVFRRR